MRILVTGGTGHLGSELMRLGVRAGHRVAGTYLTATPAAAPGEWHRLDIRDVSEVSDVVARVAPDVVINTAYRQSDWQVTADGAVNVARAAVQRGARTVQVSTDVVFSGEKIFYDEADTPDPITPYGAAKAAAELAVRALDAHSVIARTSLIVGNGRSSFESFVRALASGEADGVLFSDEIRCPVHVSDLASALLECAVGAGVETVHLAGPDAIARYELGRLIAHGDGLDASLLRRGKRADLLPHTPVDLRLTGKATSARIRTRLRGAREFLRTAS